MRDDKETIEDLQLGGLRLIQKKDGFRFGTDAVLLADFAKDVPSEQTLDLCCGNGIIPILLSHKTKTKKICGLEIRIEQPQCENSQHDTKTGKQRIAQRQGNLDEP